VEARLALHLTEEIKELDERIGVLLVKLDPDGIITSAPGVAQITGAQILGRLGDPNRFDSLAGVRAFSGLVPSLTASGVTGKHDPLAPFQFAVFGVRGWPPGRPSILVRQDPHDDGPRCELAQPILVDRGVGLGDARAAGHAREALKVDPQPVQSHRQVRCPLTAHARPLSCCPPSHSWTGCSCSRLRHHVLRSCPAGRTQITGPAWAYCTGSR
jgi:hypothetical protein